MEGLVLTNYRKDAHESNKRCLSIRKKMRMNLEKDAYEFKIGKYQFRNCLLLISKRKRLLLPMFLDLTSSDD